MLCSDKQILSFNQGIARLHAEGHRGNGVRIGHLDTGIDATHPAFAGRVESFRRFGYRGILEESEPIVDSGWHGTHTAGLLVGNPVDDHAIGVAPEATLCSGMVLEEGNLIARILSGLDWLLEQDVHVVSLSLGIPDTTPIFQPVLQEMRGRDIIVVVPIGNSGAGQASAPGYYSEVLSVGALDESGRVPFFSGSYHRDRDEICHKPDVLAPGVGINSCMPNSDFAKNTGTSMASAQVAGLAALLRGAFPLVTGSRIRDVLQQGTHPRDKAQMHRSAAGCVDPLATFTALEQTLKQSASTLRSSSPDAIEVQSANAGIGTIAPYIDPRLLMQLKLAGDAGLCEAVFLFDSHEQARRYRSLLENSGNQDHESQPWVSGRIKLLKHTPMLICQASSTIIYEVLSWQSLLMASACDTNRFT